MGLVARELEERGIATVCLSLLREVTEKVRPPRTLLVPFGWGRPLGPPGRDALHREVALAALGMLEEGAGSPEARVRVFGGADREPEGGDPDGGAVPRSEQDD